MRKVYQTEFVNETGRGNCLQAAVASLLGLELNDVPYFIDSDDWVINMNRFINKHGFFLNECDISKNKSPMLVFGKSPRGDFHHAVIYKNGKLYHDPHPENSGVETIFYCAELLKIKPNE